MSRLSKRFAISSHSLLALVLAVSAPGIGRGQTAGNQVGHGSTHSPVYQRRAFDWSHSRGKWHGRGHDHRGVRAPQVSEGWFQRPYPYHLDYYRMRYGGSYAPYFGNLYGPPQVVTAPPYYGPYYGNDGSVNGPSFEHDYVYPAPPVGTNPVEQDDAGPQAKDALAAPPHP